MTIQSNLQNLQTIDHFALARNPIVSYELVKNQNVAF